jgi:hypothetical protein
MSTTEPTSTSVRQGIAVGALLVFAVVALTAAALGAELWVALLVGAFVGLFVGGGIGLLMAARQATDDA